MENPMIDSLAGKTWEFLSYGADGQPGGGRFRFGGAVGGKDTELHRVLQPNCCADEMEVQRTAPLILNPPYLKRNVAGCRPRAITRTIPTVAAQPPDG